MLRQVHCSVVVRERVGEGGGGGWGFCLSCDYSRAVTEGWGLGISPGFYEDGLHLLLWEN